jgi:hypothetical protein
MPDQTEEAARLSPVPSPAISLYNEEKIVAGRPERRSASVLSEGSGRGPAPPLGNRVSRRTSTENFYDRALVDIS